MDACLERMKGGAGGRPVCVRARVCVCDCVRGRRKSMRFMKANEVVTSLWFLSVTALRRARSYLLRITGEVQRLWSGLG